LSKIITRDHNHHGVDHRSIRRNRLYIADGIIAGFVFLLAAWSMANSAQAQARPDGKALFEKRCGGCHSLDRDKEGPRLRDVYGRTAGAIQSFQYSEALKKSGLKWTDENLDKWLSDERNEIIAYLKNTGK
jgi:cytochrome c2